MRKQLIPQFGEAGCKAGDATTLARSIVGQQISVKAAQSVWDRFAACPGKLPAGTGPRFGVEEQRGAGLSARKVEYLFTTWPLTSTRARFMCANGSRWTTKPSLTSWWPSAASVAGRPRCS